MDATAAVDTVLTKLELKFEHEDSGRRCRALLDHDRRGRRRGCRTPCCITRKKGRFCASIAYVDEVDEDNTLEQLKLVLVLNGDLPTGAFCLDPEEGVIDVTVNLPVGETDAGTAELDDRVLFRGARDVCTARFTPRPKTRSPRGSFGGLRHCAP